MKTKITVMSDFGDAIFWDEYGTNIDLPDEDINANISDTLLKEFETWHKHFEDFEFETNPNFSWSEYHKKGVELSQRLQLELGNSFEIIYEKPFEDPSSRRIK